MPPEPPATLNVADCQSTSDDHNDGSHEYRDSEENHLRGEGDDIGRMVNLGGQAVSPPRSLPLQ
jgi:hypothetical protein